MTDARIDLDDAQVLAWLDRLRQLPRREGRSIMASIGRYMKTAMQMRFRRQVDPDGKPWVPSKAAKARGGQTLRDTNRLFRSLTWRAGSDYAEAGTNVVYAAVNHFGILKVVNVGAHRRMIRRDYGERGAFSVRASMVKAHRRLMFRPARRFAGFGQADVDGILAILRRRITEAAQK
ncbi:phage virion morphogenesis protein [Luteimonas soli]|uniref:Phage virion morphogenesis protein n=1 Tax=Luteimonas soli TaxID=1648966 RepID=A0ABV7XP92_9GAMM